MTQRSRLLVRGGQSPLLFLGGGHMSLKSHNNETTPMNPRCVCVCVYTAHVRCCHGNHAVECSRQSSLRHLGTCVCVFCTP